MQKTQETKKPKLLKGKKNFAKQMHLLCPDYHIYEYEDFLTIFMEAIEYCVDEDQHVSFPDFGKFMMKHRKAYTTSAGMQGKTMHVPAFSYLGFLPAPNLRQRYFNRTKSDELRFEDGTYVQREESKQTWERINQKSKQKPVVKEQLEDDNAIEDGEAIADDEQTEAKNEEVFNKFNPGNI